MEAIIAGDYKFEPQEYWENVSDTAKDFVRACLTIDPAKRPTAEDMLNHKWLADTKPHFVEDKEGNITNLLPHIQKAFDARKTFRKAVFSMMAMKRMSILASQLSPQAQKLGDNIAQYKEESEKVRPLSFIPCKFPWLTIPCRKISTKTATSSISPTARAPPAHPTHPPTLISRNRSRNCPSTLRKSDAFIPTGRCFLDTQARRERIKLSG